MRPSLHSLISFKLGKGFKPYKKFSQNFLANDDVLEKEIAYANLKKKDHVLEVGAGFGYLTAALEEFCQVTAIEIDKRFFPEILKNVSQETTIIMGDAKKVDFPKFNKFVCNIPYHISMPITLKLLRSDFELGVMICQEEFAKKLIAKKDTKYYGRVSVLAQYYADIEIKEKVNKSDFIPSPKVTSVIVVFRKKRPLNENFEEWLSSLFRQRRKKIKSVGKRPEKLSPEDLIELFESLQ